MFRKWVPARLGLASRHRNRPLRERNADLADRLRAVEDRLGVDGDDGGTTAGTPADD
jgi:hypothetical protein